MKKLFFKFIFTVPVIALALVIFFASNFAQAATVPPPPSPNFINVLFDNHAPTAQLFNEVNFLPGDEITKTIQIENIYTDPVNLSLKLYPYIDDDGLGSQMDAVIKKQGASGNIFSGTLKELSEENPLVLSAALAAGSINKYDFSVTFKPETNNDYQGKSLGFDVLIEAQSQDGIVQTYGSTGGSSGGGGFSSCGNGIIESGEQCDNPSGNGPLPNFCSGSCTLNSDIRGTSTPFTGSLSYEENGGPPVQGLVNGGLAATRGPGAGIGAGAGENGGKILGETTQAKDENTPVGVCSSHYWWWWIGYLIYAILLLFIFWIVGKEKLRQTYIIGGLLFVVAVLWWWFEPCPKHFWIWPIGMAVYTFVLYSIFNPRKQNTENQTQLPL